MSGYFVVQDMITNGALPREPEHAMLRAVLNTVDVASTSITNRPNLPRDIFIGLWRYGPRPQALRADLCSQRLIPETLQWALANVDEAYLASRLASNNTLTATQLDDLINRLRNQGAADPEIEREIGYLIYRAVRLSTDPEATREAAIAIGGPALILWLDRFDMVLDDATLEAVVTDGRWRPQVPSPSEARSLNAAMVALGERRHVVGDHPTIRHLRQAAGIVPQRLAEQLKNLAPAKPTYEHAQRVSDAELLDEVLHSQVPVVPGGADALAAHLAGLYGTDQTAWELLMTLSCEYEGTLADTIAVVESLRTAPPAVAV